MSADPDASPLSSPREIEPIPQLTAEQEAILDKDPLERIYDSNKIEAPQQLSVILGCFTKLIMLQERDDVADYAVEYFEHMKLSRAADPKIDFDKFISTQMKLLEKKLDLSTFNYNKEFAPPANLQPILIAFSKEVIRYQPTGDLFGFALEYFTCINDEGSPHTFLTKQAKLADEKQKTLDIEKRRAKLAKEKAAKKKVSMN